MTAQAVSAVPLERRPVTTSNEITIPLSAIPVACSEEPMSALLERMVSREGHPALVLDANDRVIGTVSSSDVQRAAALARAGSNRAPERGRVLVVEHHLDQHTLWSGRRDSNPRPSPWQGDDSVRLVCSGLPPCGVRPPSFHPVHCSPALWSSGLLRVAALRPSQWGLSRPRWCP